MSFIVGDTLFAEFAVCCAQFRCNYGRFYIDAHCW